MHGTMTSTVVIHRFCHVSRPARLSVTQATMFLAFGNSPLTRFSTIKARMARVEIARNPMKIKLDSPKEISAP